MKAAYLTHIGLRRRNNQDCICYVEKEDAVLAMVCDGIGGSKAGDVASSMACMHMKDRFLQQDFAHMDKAMIQKWIVQGIQEANDLIFVQSKKVREMDGMGTTITGVLISKQVQYVFNAGDSRVYAFKQHLRQLTSDHTFVQRLIRNGEITEEQAKSHPMRNMLINAVGIWNAIQIDVEEINQDYDALLISSDGLHGYVKPAQIEAILNSAQTTAEKCEALVEASLQAGGYDNVSVILLEQGEGSV